jgi:aspartate/methionine/tyrosine aminotransferase
MPASAATTCWPSGSAKATRSRRSWCATPPPQSLQRGETFYSHNLGLPELREAIAAMPARCTARSDADRIAVTSSGVSALMIAMQMLAGAGDEVVAVVPVWPNLTAQPAILGAKVVRVALQPDAAAPGGSTCRPCWPR